VDNELGRADLDSKTPTTPINCCNNEVQFDPFSKFDFMDSICAEWWFDKSVNLVLNQTNFVYTTEKNIDLYSQDSRHLPKIQNKT
jgi:hypothetical protein